MYEELQPKYVIQRSKKIRMLLIGMNLGDNCESLIQHFLSGQKRRTSARTIPARGASWKESLGEHVSNGTDRF